MLLSTLFEATASQYIGVDIVVLSLCLLTDNVYFSYNAVQRKLVDEFLPFFDSNCLKDGDEQKSSTNNDLDPLKRDMGVPTHYQNDGSYFYMLTPVVSPPSADSVSRWLLHVDSGIVSN